MYAHAALQNHNILPSDYLRLPVADRAFLAASDIVTAKRMKKE